MPRTRTPRRTFRAVLLSGLALALVGCATVPTSGPVRAGDDQRLERAQVAVPFIATPPQPGASAEEVVRGFLRAGADFRNDHLVARLYLTPQARQRWQAGTSTTVYDRIDVPVTPGQTVTAQGTQVAQIDAEGRYRRVPPGSDVVRTFSMARVDGEWRIGSLEDGLLLSQVDVEESYRQVALYFLSPSLNTLVPDTVLLPELPGLSTKLVSRLLRGPTGGLRGAVVSAFPQGTQLEVPSVPVIEGLARVRLDETALDADDEAREQMAAQIVWTVKQLGPEVAAVRITAGTEDLVVSGVAEEQPRDSWLTFDPNGLSDAPSFYVVRDGALGRILDDGFRPVLGAAGSGAVPLRTAAVSLDESRVAGVGSDGRTLYVGRLAREGTLARVATGGDLGAPSWDPLGNLWFVDRTTGAVSVLPTDGDSPVAVETAGLPTGGVTQLALSRDGARVALVAGRGGQARLLVATLSGVDRLGAEGEASGGSVSLLAPHEVLPDLRAVRDVAWADAETLAVLGSRAGLPVAPMYTSTDGYEVEPVQAETDLVALAAAPPVGNQTSPLVVETAAGRLQQFTPGSGLVLIGEGSAPAYPG